MVENAVNRKVAGIVLAASDPDALVPAVKKAWEAHIPVVIIDSALSDPSKPYYQVPGFPVHRQRKGRRGVCSGVDRAGGADGQDCVDVVCGRRGFRKYLAAHSKLQVVGPFYSQSQMANALNQTTDVLAANPDLKGILGANEPTTVGMGRALGQSGKAGKVIAVGFDGNADLQNFVKDGTIQAIAEARIRWATRAFRR